jgi:hypothetical protein
LKISSIESPVQDDRQSFLKGQIVRKVPPKQKLGADMVEMIDDLKELENGVFECYAENHNWTHKSYRWELPCAKTLILPRNVDLMHQE